MSLKNFSEKCVPVSQDFHKKESFLGVLSNFHTSYFSEHRGEVGVS